MTGKISICLLTFLCSVSIFGQKPIKLTRIDIVKSPVRLKHEGILKEAFRWADKFGDNILITAESGITYSGTGWNASGQAKLYACLFIGNTDSAKETWKVFDEIKDCGGLVKANFVKNSFMITDLDHNGIAENWLMYKLDCYGSLEPIKTKILMHEGMSKFELTGHDRVQVGFKTFEGGDFVLDKAFSEGPAAFRTFAKNLWEKNKMQTMD